jgi:hypothetical protein
MRGKLPGARTAHGEAPDDDALRIDLVVRKHIAHCLESVDFTGELVRAAKAPVEMQHDRALRHELAFGWIAGLE